MSSSRCNMFSGRPTSVVLSQRVNVLSESRCIAHVARCKERETSALLLSVSKPPEHETGPDFLARA